MEEKKKKRRSGFLSAITRCPNTNVCAGLSVYTNTHSMSRTHKVAPLIKPPPLPPPPST